MTEVIMPKMGDGMEEGTLLEWLKKDGDTVKSGEIIGTIQTDKATLELEAPGSGKLTGFLIKGGETVPVGKAIAAIVGNGEALPSDWGGSNGASAKQQAPSQPREPEPKSNLAVEPSSGGSKEGSQVENVPANGASAQLAATEAGSSEGRVKASPLAKKIAQEKGIDLGQITGTGPGGRIVEKDVREAKSAVIQAPAASSQPAPQGRSVDLNRLRQITAKRTTESKQQVPHFYVTVEVDVESILALRQQFEAEESGKVSINDFVVRACVRALQDMPEINAVFQGTKLDISGEINIGIAAAIEEGLTVPVLRNANSLSLREISARTKDLVKRAHENKLSMDELSGSTFSITNMGMLDVDNFIAIINQPNSAILAVSTARKKVVATADDEVEIRSRMNITCSFDHRAIDGALGAKFINVVKGYLENPTRLLA